MKNGINHECNGEASLAPSIDFMGALWNCRILDTGLQQHGHEGNMEEIKEMNQASASYLTILAAATTGAIICN